MSAGVFLVLGILTREVLARWTWVPQNLSDCWLRNHPGKPVLLRSSMPYGSTWAATMKCHRLVGLNHRHSFNTVLEAGKPKLRGNSMLRFFVRILILACRQCLLSVTSLWGGGGERVESKLSGLFFKGTHPTMWTPPSRPHQSLITYQRPHVQIPPHCGQGFQHMAIRGTQFSPSHVHSPVL